MKSVVSRLLLGFILVIILSPVSASAENTIYQRIEQEDKLVVPIDKADKVWKFLQENYVLDQEKLKKIDSLLISYSTEEIFIDTYYDTSSLKFLNEQNSVRHRKRQNLTNPEDNKNNKELVQIKISNISDNALNRGEIKFDVSYPNNIQNTEDWHPLVGIIAKNDRANFKKYFEQIGINPLSLKPVLTLTDNRRRIYINRDKQPFIALSLDDSVSKIWWAKARFIEIETELNEITYTQADSETRKSMEEINHKIIEEIKQKYSSIVSDPTPKYNKAFNQLSSQIPFLRWLIRLGIFPIS